MTASTLYGLDSPTMRIGSGHMVVGLEGDVDIPVSPFVIVHEKGNVLFDTGFHPDICDDPALVFGDRPETDMVTSSPEQKLEQQLEMIGLSLEDITHMVVSHIHTDHAGALFQFPNAKFFVGPGEFEYGRAPNEESAHLVMEHDFLTDEIQGYDWTVTDSARYDLFGDGAIELLHLPGHTPGQLALLVRLPSQNIILSADVVHLREAIELHAPSPTDWDPELAKSSITKLLQIADEEDAKLWIAHDHRDWAEFGAPRTPIS